MSFLSWVHLFWNLSVLPNNSLKLLVYFSCLFTCLGKYKNNLLTCFCNYQYLHYIFFKICITIIQRQLNVFAVDPTLYKMLYKYFVFTGIILHLYSQQQTVTWTMCTRCRQYQAQSLIKHWQTVRVFTQAALYVLFSTHFEEYVTFQMLANKMSGVLGHLRAQRGETGPGPPEDGKMNEMTLPSRHRTRTLAVWGRARYFSVTDAPHILNLYEWAVKNHFVTLKLECNTRSPSFQAGNFNHGTRGTFRGIRNILDVGKCSI